VYVTGHFFSRLLFIIPEHTETEDWGWLVILSFYFAFFFKEQKKLVVLPHTLNLVHLNHH